MVFEQLQQLLDSQGARYRVLAHSAEGKSDEVARIRGTEPGQGAKAMLCKTKSAAQGEHWVLAVLPGDQKLDFRKLAAALGLPKMTLASPDEATALTGCVMGAVPQAGDRVLVRLVFFGETAFQPLTARLVAEIGPDVNILAGAIDEIAGEPFGSLVVSYPADVATLERAGRFYAETGLTTEVIGYGV